MAKRTIMLLLACMFALSGLLQAAAIDDFRMQISKATSPEASLNIIQDFSGKLSSIEDLRELQSYWLRQDPESCKAYFEKQRAANPLSPTYKYLNLRMEEDAELQLSGGRELCQQHPDFYWGYRLFVVGLTETILDPDTQPDKILEANRKDFGIIDSGLKRFPDDDYLNLFQFHRFRLAKEYALAQEYLYKMKGEEALGTNWQKVVEFIVESRRIEVFSKLFPRLLSFTIAKGQMAATDSLQVYQQQYLSTLQQMEDWDATAAFFAASPQLRDESYLREFYEQLLIARKDFEQLTSRLSVAVEKGESDYLKLQDADTYGAAFKHPGWNALLAKAKSKWDADEPVRRAEALKDRLNKPAPLWELPDSQGKLVKLADYKGQVVILDFWATWCGPCRMAMPALNGWMQHEMPAGVKVFSINVWENADEKAKAYFSENAFAMTLLFGEDSMAKDYGFDGIPYICVIDKRGQVAFQQAGYSPTLEASLTYWVQALNAE